MRPSCPEGTNLEPQDERRRHPSTRRVTAAVLLGVTVATGLAVHAWAPDSAVSDAAGDVLYAIAVFLFLAFLLPRLSPLAVAACAGGWCVAIECFQLTGLPELWALTFSPITLVFGTVFDPRDLLMYVLGVAFAACVDVLVRRIGRTRLRRRSSEVT